jgi:hypothetical protein
MKTEDLQDLENLSKARRLLETLDDLISVAESLNDKVPTNEKLSIIVPLQSARAASANLMARYGDIRGYAPRWVSGGGWG